MYVLITKDDFLGYIWLLPCTEATAQVTAESLIAWFAAFGTALIWVTDQGSHCKNAVIHRLQEEIHMLHHFKSAYTPWSNGTEQVVCREIAKTTRALLSEFQLPFKDWSKVVQLVRAALNSTPLKRLKDKCPLEVFSGLKHYSAFCGISKQNGNYEILSVDHVRATQLKDMNKFKEAFDKLHRDISVRSTAKRKASRQSHNCKTRIGAPNFRKGDYVLNGILESKTKPKLSLQWTGPYRVTDDKNHYIFEGEDLTNGHKKLFHGHVLKFFKINFLRWPKNYNTI